jgi:hypothetical protein
MATEKQFKIVHDSTAKGNNTTKIDFTLDEKIHKKEVSSLRNLCIAYVFEDVIEYLVGKQHFTTTPHILLIFLFIFYLYVVMQRREC